MTYEEDITQQAGEDKTDDKKENITHDANITQHDREKQKSENDKYRLSDDI